MFFTFATRAKAHRRSLCNICQTKCVHCLHEDTQTNMKGKKKKTIIKKLESQTTPILLGNLWAT